MATTVVIALSKTTAVMLEVAMALTHRQVHLIAAMDKKINAVLQRGGDKAMLLAQMAPMLPAISSIFDAAADKEWNLYCQAYEGFRQYVQALVMRGIG